MIGSTLYTASLHKTMFLFLTFEEALEYLKTQKACIILWKIKDGKYLLQRGKVKAIGKLVSIQQ